MKYLLIDIAIVLAAAGGVFGLCSLIAATLDLIFKGDWVVPIVAGVTAGWLLGVAAAAYFLSMLF